MKKYIQLIKNTALFALASMATKIISFIFIPLYTSYLTTAEYAIADLATVMQSLIWPILSLSLTEGILRFALDKEYDKDEVFTNATLLLLPGVIISGFIFLCFNFNEELFAYRIYISIYYLVVSMNSYLSVFCRTIDKLKLITMNSIFSSIVIALCNLYFLTQLNMGIVGYFIALIIGNGLSVLSYILGGKLYHNFKLKKYNKKIIKPILIYSIPMIPNTIFWWINSSLDKFTLTYMVGLSAVGLYSVAGKISSALTMCTSIFNQAWSMSAFKEYKENDVDNFFSNIYNIYNILLCFVASTLVIATKFIAKVMFANEFFVAWKYVPLLVIAFYFNGLNVFLGTIFTTNKKTKVIFWTTGIGALFNIIFNVILINYMGIVGAAVATVISNFIVYVVRYVCSKQYIKLKTYPVHNTALILCIVLLGIFIMLEYKQVALIIYCFILLLIILIGKDYIKLIKKQIRKV